jgi:hypothetical protein
MSSRKKQLKGNEPSLHPVPPVPPPPLPPPSLPPAAAIPPTVSSSSVPTRQGRKRSSNEIIPSLSLPPPPLPRSSSSSSLVTVRAETGIVAVSASRSRAATQPRASKKITAVPVVALPSTVGQDGCPAIRLTIKLLVVPSRIDDLKQTLSKGAAPSTFSVLTRKIKPRAGKYDKGEVKRIPSSGAELVILVRKSDGLILAAAGHEIGAWSKSDDMNPGIKRDDLTLISNIYKVTHAPDTIDEVTVVPARIGTTLSVELLPDRLPFTTSSKLYNSSVRRRYVSALKKVKGEKRPAWNDATEHIDTKDVNIFEYVTVTFLLRVSPYSQDDETAMLDVDTIKEGTQNQNLRQILNALWVSSRKQGNFELTEPGVTVSKAISFLASEKGSEDVIKSLYAEAFKIVSEEQDELERERKKMLVPASVSSSISALLTAAQNSESSARTAQASKAAVKAAAARAVAVAKAAETAANAGAGGLFGGFFNAGATDDDDNEEVIILDDDDDGLASIKAAEAVVKSAKASYNQALEASEKRKALDDANTVREALARAKKVKAKLDAVKEKMKAIIAKPSSTSSKTSISPKTTIFSSVSDVINSLEPEAIAEAALHPSVRALNLTAIPLASASGNPPFLSSLSAAPAQPIIRDDEGEETRMISSSSSSSSYASSAAAAQPMLMDTSDENLASPFLFRLKPYQRSAIHWMLERELVYERKKAEQLKSIHENAADLARGETKEDGGIVSEGLEIRLIELCDADAFSTDNLPPSLQRLGFLGRLIHDSRERYLPIISDHGHHVGISILDDDKYKYDGDEEDKVVDVNALTASAVHRVETYAVLDAQIKDVKKDALRQRQEQQVILTSRRAGKAPVSYVSEFQKEVISAPSKKEEASIPSKGRKRSAAVSISTASLSVTELNPVEKKSKPNPTNKTEPIGKTNLAGKLNPTEKLAPGASSSSAVVVPTAVIEIVTDEEEDEDDDTDSVDGNARLDDFLTHAPPKLPEYSVPLPWIFDTPVIRARDHPFWITASGIELDTGASDLSTRVMKSRRGRLGPSHAHSADVPVASEKVPFRIKPCCGYFMRMGTMDIARERCSACKKRDLFANPKAASEVIDVSTPLISNASSHSSSSSLAPPSSIIAEVSSFDGLARAGILSDEMGLGKTLEIIGLVVVHPRSSQPFDASGFQTGTYALDKAVRTLSLPLLSAGLTELARLPTTASIAFQVCNSRALRTWNEAMTQTYRSFVRQDMFHLLGSADNSVIDSRATLVIAPASILGQWQSEIARWCPKLAVVVYSSDPNWRFCATSGKWVSSCPCGCFDSSFDVPPTTEDALKMQPQEDPTVKDGVYYPKVCPHGKQWSGKPGEWPCCAAASKERTRMRMFLSMASADIVLASYDQLQAMTDQPSHGYASLKSFMWWRCVLDEIQQVDTQAEEAMSKQMKKDIENRTAAAMSLQAVNRWAVSGTPIETPSDMKAILQFLRHQPFADPDLWARTAEPALKLSNVRDDTEKMLKKIQDLLVKTEYDAELLSHAVVPPSVPYPDYNSYNFVEQQEKYHQSRKLVRDYNAAQELVESSFKAAFALSEAAVSKSARIKSIHSALMSIRDRFKLNRHTGSSLTPTTAALFGAEVSALAMTFEPKKDAKIAEAEELVAAAEVQPLVRRLGSGLDLLASLLRPTMWRNTQARVSTMGQLSLPPVTEVVVRIQLTASEDHVLREIQRNYTAGVVTQLRQLVRAEGEQALAMQATEAAKKAALANLGVAGLWAAPSMNPLEVAVVARQALWDLRSCCAHLTASSRIAERLGLRGHFAASGSSLLEVMRLFVMVAEDKLQAAALEVIESATIAAQQLVRVLPRLRAILKKFEEDDVDEALAEEWVAENFASLVAHKDDKREKESKEVEAERALAIDMMSKQGELKSFREEPLLNTVQKLINKTVPRLAAAEKTFRFKVEILEKGSRGGIEAKAHLLKPGDNLETFKFPPRKIKNATMIGDDGAEIIASGTDTEDEIEDATHPTARRKKIAIAWGKAMTDLTRAKRDLENAVKGQYHDGPDMWACLKCSLLNAIDCKKCIACSALRPQTIEGIADDAEPEGRKSRKSKTNAAVKLQEVDGKGAGFVFKSAARTFRERELRSTAAEALVPDFQSKLNYALASENVYEKLSARAASKDKKLDEEEEEEDMDRDDKVESASSAVATTETAAYKITDRAAAVAAILAASQKAADLRAKRASSASSSSAGAAAAASASTEEEGLSCIFCLDDIVDENTAALTPCGHLFHKECIAGFIFAKNQQYGVPVDIPGEESMVWARLKPTMHAQCPSCRTGFSASQLTVVSSTAGGSKRAEEVEVIPLSVFLEQRVSNSDTSAVGSNASSFFSSMSSSLSSSILPSSIVNDVRLEGAEEAAKNAALRKRVDKAMSGAPRVSTRSVYEASVEAYGGKVACLVRRLKSMPDIEQTKAIVATSWPALRPLIAKALLAEGIEAGVLDGTPSEMALVLQRFVSPPPRPRSEILIDLTGGSSEHANLDTSSTGVGDGIGNSSIVPTPAKRLKSSFSRKNETRAVSSRPPPRVLILSLGSDCAGLTLTAASHLFVLDPPLSPAIMSQLIGRICRQGQTRPCTVFHFVVKDSVEEKMIKVRAKLARGDFSSTAAAVDSTARSLLKKGRVDASAAASTDRLNAVELLELIDNVKEGKK